MVVAWLFVMMASVVGAQRACDIEDLVGCEKMVHGLANVSSLSEGCMIAQKIVDCLTEKMSEVPGCKNDVTDRIAPIKALNNAPYSCNLRLPSEPKKPKHGTCPDTSGMMGICVEQCTRDAECKEGDKCCSNGCGHSCMKAVPTPTPPVPTQAPPTTLNWRNHTTARVWWDRSTTRMWWRRSTTRAWWRRNTTRSWHVETTRPIHRTTPRFEWDTTKRYSKTATPSKHVTERITVTPADPCRNDEIKMCFETLRLDEMELWRQNEKRQRDSESRHHDDEASQGEEPYSEDEEQRRHGPDGREDETDRGRDEWEDRNQWEEEQGRRHGPDGRDNDEDKEREEWEDRNRWEKHERDEATDEDRPREHEERGPGKWRKGDRGDRFRDEDHDEVRPDLDLPDVDDRNDHDVVGDLVDRHRGDRRKRSLERPSSSFNTNWNPWGPLPDDTARDGADTDENKPRVGLVKTAEGRTDGDAEKKQQVGLLKTADARTHDDVDRVPALSHTAVDVGNDGTVKVTNERTNTEPDDIGEGKSQTGVNGMKPAGIHRQGVDGSASVSNTGVVGPLGPVSVSNTGVAGPLGPIPTLLRAPLSNDGPFEPAGSPSVGLVNADGSWPSPGGNVDMPAPTLVIPPMDEETRSHICKIGETFNRCVRGRFEVCDGRILDKVSRVMNRFMDLRKHGCVFADFNIQDPSDYCDNEYVESCIDTAKVAMEEYSDGRGPPKDDHFPQPPGHRPPKDDHFPRPPGPRDPDRPPHMEMDEKMNAEFCWIGQNFNDCVRGRYAFCDQKVRDRVSRMMTRFMDKKPGCVYAGTDIQDITEWCDHDYAMSSILFPYLSRQKYKPTQYAQDNTDGCDHDHVMSCLEEGDVMLEELHNRGPVDPRLRQPVGPPVRTEELMPDMDEEIRDEFCRIAQTFTECTGPNVGGCPYSVMAKIQHLLSEYRDEVDTKYCHTGDIATDDGTGRCDHEEIRACLNVFETDMAGVREKLTAGRDSDRYPSKDAGAVGEAVSHADDEADGRHLRPHDGVPTRPLPAKDSESARHSQEMDEEMKEKFCRLGESFRSCVKPKLEGCPDRVTDMVDRTLNKFTDKHGYNCGIGDTADPTPSPSETCAVTINKCQIAHTDTNRGISEREEARGGQRDIPARCKSAEVYITCMRPVLSKCPMQARTIRDSLKRYNRKPFDCGLDIGRKEVQPVPTAGYVVSTSLVSAVMVAIVATRLM